MGKSLSLEQHTYDLAEGFEKLEKLNSRLNPEKCTFRVGRGKFLGFMLTYRGIKANPNKCEAFIAMRSLENVNEFEKMIGRLAFVS